jgi:lipoprotein-anchoring transpeptidase ErfK/SrfK
VRDLRTILLAAASLLSITISSSALAAEDIQIKVSVPEQKLYVFDGTKKLASYRVSTSAFGIGDGRGTYATPLGHLEVASKVGSGAPVGTVFKGRSRTGEICPVNAKGRDPIVTRILHLRGLEKQNERAYGRGIYIHGTPDERNIGHPASYGCVRMKSRDIVRLFDMVPVGASVEITDKRIGGIFGIVSRTAVTKPVIAAKVK